MPPNLALNLNNDFLWGVEKLCSEPTPDGIALVGDPAMVVVFKGGYLWPVPLKSVIQAIFNDSTTNRSQTYLFTKDNQRIASSYWPEFPISLIDQARFVFSFTGLPADDSYHDNLIVLKDDGKVFRYDTNKKSLLAEGVYTNWYHMNKDHLKIVGFLPIKGTRMLLITTQIDGNRYYTHVFKFNDANFGSPASFSYRVKAFPYENLMNSSRNIYTLESNHILAFTRDNLVCLNNKCIDFKRLVYCDAGPMPPSPVPPKAPNGKTDASFARWLSSKTKLTIRSLMSGILAVMVINITVAFAFIVNQVSIMRDLT